MAGGFSLLTLPPPPPPGLYAWGYNYGSNLGLNDTVNRSSPTQVGVGTTWSLVSIGWYNTAATKTDGTLWTWGWNSLGQLGTNDHIYRSSPVQVGVGTTWSQVSTNYYATAAVKTDGTLWTWGWNSNGSLGNNDGTSAGARSSPTQVGSGTTWSQVSAGSYNAIATKTDGTLWAWGYNYYGELGLGDQGVNSVSSNRSSPTQVGALTNWSKVSTLVSVTVAIKTDGTLWAWGYNANGELGQNDTVYNKNSPVQVGTLTTWSQVSTAGHNTIATKTDGTLWIWGRNDYGELGQNDQISRSSPTQVGSGTTWNLVTINNYVTIATKTNGTLWTWGWNSRGQLGFNDLVNRSSPTQVGVATTWSRVSGGQYSTMAILN